MLKRQCQELCNFCIFKVSKSITFTLMVVQGELFITKKKWEKQEGEKARHRLSIFQKKICKTRDPPGIALVKIRLEH